MKPSLTRSGAARSRVLVALAAVLGAAVLAACGGGGRDAAAPAPADPALAADLAENEVEKPAALVWGPCEEVPSAECATLDVPLDYREPHGRRIHVALSRITTARPERRRGVLLLNPGGPGSAGLDLPQLFDVLLPPEVREQYDLIGFDPRFVGRSAPLDCDSTLEQAVALYAVPDFDTAEQQSRLLAQQCGERAGDVLPFITTANTARDMDLVRRALGETKISYLGYSYGTYLGAVYASLFPGRVDRFVLDSAVDPDGVWRGQLRSWGAAAERRFADLAAYIAARHDTYQFGTTVDEVRARFLQTVQALEAHPLDRGIVVDGDLFRLTMFSNLYAPDSALPIAADIWKSFDDEARDPLAAVGGAAFALPLPLPLPLLDDAPDPFAATPGVLCGDVRWSRSPERYRREYQRDLQRYPLFGSIGSGPSACAFWPVDPVEPLVKMRAHGPGELLIVQNLRDPSTPVEGARVLRRQLGTRARLLTADQGGHGAYLSNDNGCVDAVVSLYLATGERPREDMLCTVEPPAAAAARQKAQPDAVRDEALRELRRRIR